ncbi:MAG: hypothetical protein KTR31_35930 [Myxococcales bacterium]|nr:hypothetical protein [Myxococcales bacterium]
MTKRGRAFIGVITTVVFAVLGGTLWAEGQTTLGGVLLVLAALRAALAITQLRDAFVPADDDG